MENLIPLINKLQDVFHSVGLLDTIDLPQIAVVGSQSSGKSSVLEHIVGRDFLPRGTGIVTRRPLVLQLSNVPKGNNEAQQEWGEFLHIPGKKFYDFNEIRNEIINETDRATSKTKNVSPLPINLKIFSPYVLNLTLIDLPGITKVPVGDQPPDIELQIRKMILQFITKPNCIILAVTAANTDIANSDALKMAREVDKPGTRTLGVLTKLDLMDQGTDCMDVIRGQVIPLKLGYIGLVLRGQQDINQNKVIRAAIKDEQGYFMRSPAYASVADKMGTLYLAKTLNNILLNHIRESLPEIKNKVIALLAQTRQVLSELGEDTNMGQGGLLLQLVSLFTNDFIETIDGKTTEMSTNDLIGGARLNYIFNEVFAPYLTKMDACEGLPEKDIKMAIRNAKGPRSSLFIPESAFEMLVKKQVKKLEDPSLRCVDHVFDELVRLVEHGEKHLARFPNLRERVVEFSNNLLRDYAKPLRDFISNLISIEMAYINTNHPDFFAGGSTVSALVEKIQHSDVPMQQQQQLQAQNRVKMPLTNSMQHNVNQPMDREKIEADIIRALLTQYFEIVRKNICDSVPKAIMHFLVDKTKSNLQSELVASLYKDELFQELLKESDEVATKRKAAQEMLKVLQKAQDIINEVRDFRA